MIFDTVKKARVNRTMFNLSHEKKFTAKMGLLYPTLIQECVPGDKFNIDSDSMIRFAPMVAPMMHEVNAFIHFFFVPNRLLWTEWEDFITGDQAISLPMMNVNNVASESGTILDFLGLPNHTYSGVEINTLPLRAYKLIWNTYYRDQNLCNELDITDDDTHTLLRRAWEKDYFTSALPWTQKGANVTVDADGVVTYRQESLVYDYGVGVVGASTLGTDIGGKVTSDGTQVYIDNIDQIEAQIDINELRRASRLQRWLERNARAGSRYAEHLLAHWGIRPNDSRLQRPEYLGGGKSPVMVSEVLNTAGSEDANAHPVGQMSGHGINVGTTNRANKYCEEHGFIIGIMSVLPKTAYSQGIPKMLTRKSNTDFYYPEFARLGEQEVLRQEVYAENSSVTNQEVFGYQSRYAEYKYATSTVHGDFRGNMNHWTMAREFLSTPNLNQAFVEATPTDRIFAVTNPSEDKLYCQVYNKVLAKRPMPYYSDPTL